MSMEWKQTAQQWAKRWAEAVRGPLGCRRTSKQYLAGFWSNSDSELPQEINAQNGTCHCGLLKFGCKKLALKQAGFGHESPSGDWLAICTLKQGARWTGIGRAGNNILCCPSVHQLPIVHQLIRYKNEACIFAEKYMTVAVACVDSAAELVRVRQRFSFLNTSRGKSLVNFVAVKVVKLTHAIVRILERKKLEPEGGRLLEQALLFLLSLFLLLAGAGLLLCWVMAAATVGSWPPRASHKASTALTIATAVFWFLALTASSMEGDSRIKNIAKKRSLSGLTLFERCCLSFPMRTLGLRPCISMGSRSSYK